MKNRQRGSFTREGKIGSLGGHSIGGNYKMLELFGFEKTTVNYHDYRDSKGRKFFSGL